MSSFSIMYESLIRHTPTSVVIIDEDGKIVEMNPSFQSKFSFITGTGTFLSDHPSFMKKSIRQLIRRGFQQLKSEGQECHFEVDGRLLVMSVTASPVQFRENGSVSMLGLIMHDVTKQHETTVALYEASRQVEQLSKYQKVVMYKFSREGHNFVFRYAGGNLMPDLGLKEERLIDRSLVDLLPGEEAEYYTKLMNRVWFFHEEETFEGTYRGIDYIGSIVPVIQNGQTIELICTITDLTAKKSTERLLQMNEQKYKSLMKFSPDHIFLLDKHGMIQELNEVAKASIQFPAGEMIGKHFKEYIQVTTDNRQGGNFEQALNGTAVRFQAAIRNADDTVTDIACTLVPIRINGQIEGVYGIGRDITESLKMSSKLRETTELLESYLDRTGDAIVLVSPTGRIISVNHRFEQVFGYDKDEAIGQKISIIHGEMKLHEYADHMERLVNGEKVIDAEKVRFKKDGTPIHVLLNLTPIFNDNDEVIGIASIIQDISEKKLTENLLKQSEQLAMIGQLAAGVAHEIRNPLTTLKGFVQLLEEDESGAKYLSILLEEINRIEFITGELLTLAKPQAISFKVGNLATLITSSVEFMKMEAMKRNVTIELSLTDIIVKCEQNQIKQVVLNIIKNAIEAMPDGGGLTISLAERYGYAVICIEDNGVGISAARLKHLGQPFYSTKEKGTGLGLMICRKIIEDHGGKLTIESERNRGTAVSIRLPL